MGISGSRTVFIPLLIAAGALLLAGVWMVVRQPPRSEVAETVPSSATADVRIVGSESCAVCHETQFHDYQSSGHSKTLRSTRDFPFRDRFEQLQFSDSDRGETEFTERRPADKQLDDELPPTLQRELF